MLNPVTLSNAYAVSSKLGTNRTIKYNIDLFSLLHVLAKVIKNKVGVCPI